MFGRYRTLQLAFGASLAGTASWTPHETKIRSGRAEAITYRLDQEGAGVTPRRPQPMQSFEIESHERDELIDVTSRIQLALDQAGMVKGVVLAFVPHTTAGITINEHADPAVAKDVLYALDTLVAWTDPRYRHLEGNTASHVKASLMGSSVAVSVSEGRLVLGTWQGIFFCEFDGPRTRRVQLTLLPAR
jgi:secondary thiamine-phosphate synthase enzyme